MGRYIILGLVLAAIWLLLSGYLDNPLLISLGAASVVLCVYLAHHARVLDEEGTPFFMLPRAFAYWFWLAGEIGKANVAVARQALAVTPKLSPRVIRVPMTQATNAGRATFANSITLTPGTVSLVMSDGEILVHALSAEFADVASIAGMGEHVRRFEGSAK